MTGRALLAGAPPEERLSRRRKVMEAARGIGAGRGERMRRGPDTTALRRAECRLAMSEPSVARARPPEDGRSAFEATAHPRFARADGRPSRMAFEAPCVAWAGLATTADRKAPR